MVFIFRFSQTFASNTTVQSYIMQIIHQLYKKETFSDDNQPIINIIDTAWHCLAENPDVSLFQTLATVFLFYFIFTIL